MQITAAMELSANVAARAGSTVVLGLALGSSQLEAPDRLACIARARRDPGLAQ